METTLIQRLDDEAEQIIRELGIPACPAVLTRLLKEMRQDDPDFGTVTKLISSDVGLAAAMLKTVNSPFFGLRTKATSVQQAISLLGLRNVSQIVTGALLRMAFPDSGEELDHYWERSSGIAQVAARLAKPLGAMDRDEVYTFALFRDCGIPLMLRKYPKYATFLSDDLATATRPFTQIEQILFQTDHARIGSVLATSWMLPEETSTAILYHHDYPAMVETELPAGSRRLIALALVSEFLYARHIGAPNCYEWDKGGSFASQLLGVDEAGLAAYDKEVDIALQPQ
jgi:HD-like signal output (HDOD) protein